MEKIIYLYNEESYDVGVALGEDEKQELFISVESGWVEITREEYNTIRRAVNRAVKIFQLKLKNQKE